MDQAVRQLRKSCCHRRLRCSHDALEQRAVPVFAPVLRHRAPPGDRYGGGPETVRWTRVSMAGARIEHETLMADAA